MLNSGPILRLRSLVLCLLILCLHLALARVSYLGTVPKTTSVHHLKCFAVSQEACVESH